MPKLLITDHHYTDISQALAVLDQAGIKVFVAHCTTDDEVIRLGADADALISQHCPINERTLAGLPRCRIVAHFGKGVDNIDVDAASRRGVYVTSVQDANWDEVSNHVLALLLAWARGIAALDRDVKAGGWNYRLLMPRHRLWGQTIGLVGFGDIARLLARKAQGLGLRVLAHARRPDPALAAEYGVDFVSLPGLLTQADFVSVHVPLTTETRHLIGKRELTHMKPTAFLINTARGGVVDQQALLEALREGRIAGAGLDVLETEPPEADEAILQMPNVIVTPHVAWYSEESRERVTVEAALEVVRVLRGEPPRSAVNPQIQPRR